MTVTKEDKGKKVDPEARRLRRELFSDDLVDELLARADERGVALTGQGGFLPEMIKSVLERGMDAELTSHLGYQRGDRAGDGSGNSRNGTTPKTVGTEVGDLTLDQPRDRNSSFASALVPKGARRLGGLEDMIISLYAGGMTVRDIQHHLASTLGTELSHETISNVTEAVAGEVAEWQSRPLEAFYPVLYLDALVVKVRDGAHVANRAAHIAVGVDTDGVKTVLGIWIQATEGAKFWASVCSQLANRGVKDVLIVCCDGLTGFPEAIAATWERAVVQTCVVHLIRASMRFVSYTDRKAVAAMLRPIYTAPACIVIVTNLVALGMLVATLTSSTTNGTQLLLGGMQVWVTNVIGFGLLFWEVDRGGPVARHTLRRERLPPADWRFSQDENQDTVREVALGSSHHSDWRPRFIDYLYVSLTNSSAFSPTDTMPLTGRAKTLMGLEASAALLISLLVVARAIGSLG